MVSKNLSVCPAVTSFDHNYLITGRTEWAEISWGHLWQNNSLINLYLSEKWPVGQGQGMKKQHFDPISYL